MKERFSKPRFSKTEKGAVVATAFLAALAGKTAVDRTDDIERSLATRLDEHAHVIRPPKTKENPPVEFVIAETPRPPVVKKVPVQEKSAPVPASSPSAVETKKDTANLFDRLRAEQEASTDPVLQRLVTACRNCAWQKREEGKKNTYELLENIKGTSYEMLMPDPEKGATTVFKCKIDEEGLVHYPRVVKFAHDSMKIPSDATIVKTGTLDEVADYAPLVVEIMGHILKPNTRGQGLTESDVRFIKQHGVKFVDE